MTAESRTRRFPGKIRTRPALLPVGAGLLAVVVTGAQVFPPRSPAASNVIENFDDAGAASRWAFSREPDFSGAKGSFRIQAGKGRKGSKGGVLAFDFRRGGSSVAASRSFSPPLEYRGIRFRTAGWVPGTVIGARLTDETGQVFLKRLPAGRAADRGWLAHTVMAGEYEESRGGAEDGVFRGGISELSILVDKGSDHFQTGSLVMDDIEGVVSARTITDPFGPDALPAFYRGNLRNRLGVNIHDWGGWDFLGRAMDRAREAGFGFVRMDLLWRYREPVRGAYDFAWHDALLRELAARNMGAYLILDYGNPLYDDGAGARDEHRGPSTPAYRSAFARFAAAAAHRFRGRRVTFEIWNEPNIPLFWKPRPDARNYNLLARAALNAIRASAPEAPVVIGATSGIDVSFIDATLSYGGLAAVDAVSIHPYRSSGPESFFQESAIVERIVARRTKRDDISIYLGEWGYPSTFFGGRTPQAYKQQALYGIRLVLSGLLHRAPRIVWYDLVDDGDNPRDREHNFGLLKSRSLDPKPVYNALKAFRDLWPTGEITLATFDTHRADVQGLLLSGGRTKLAAIWTSRTAAGFSIGVPHRAGQRFFDAFGKPLTPLWSGPHRMLKLREDAGPVYIRLQ